MLINLCVNGFVGRNGSLADLSFLRSLLRQLSINLHLAPLTRLPERQKRRNGDETAKERV